MSAIQHIKKLAGESVVYGLSGILIRFVGLLMLPLLSKALSPAEYGIIGMYSSSFYMTFLFVVFAMDSATYRYYFDSGNDEATKRNTLATWYYFQLATSVILALLLFLFRGPLGVFLFKDTRKSIELVTLMSLALLMYALPNILEAWYRLQRKPWGAFFYSVATAGLSIILSAYCILQLKLGAIGFVIGQLSSFTLGSLYAIFTLKGWLSPKYFNRKLLGNMLRYAVPFVPANIASQALAFLLNYYLKSKLSFSEAGLYYMGNTIASVIGLVTMAVGQAWSPFAFSIADSPDAKRIYSVSLSVYVIFMCGICLGMMLFIPDLLRVFTNEKYYPAAWVGSILIFNVFLTSTCVIGMTGCGIVKKTAPYAKAVIVASVVSVALIVPMVNLFGKEGAALALLLGQLIIPGYIFYVSQKYYPIPYEFGKLAIALIIAFLLGLLGRLFFTDLSPVLSFCVKICVILLFYFSVYRLFMSEFNILIKQIKQKFA
ncbi:lipopolysaccharide biosynthesis protein [Taibaiella helva]|uniref:lipopolysaccharide biosynthesis protein n=1 Tax=Taibaiella helva TaxID=2301235 RepID=UPI000E57FEBA|nr:lipopolysaccharide biosynthesis protein [Taibaiella helva]